MLIQDGLQSVPENIFNLRLFAFVIAFVLVVIIFDVLLLRECPSTVLQSWWGHIHSNDSIKSA
jgi:hypothetical protein